MHLEPRSHGFGKQSTTTISSVGQTSIAQDSVKAEPIDTAQVEVHRQLVRRRRSGVQTAAQHRTNPRMRARPRVDRGGRLGLLLLGITLVCAVILLLLFGESGIPIHANTVSLP